MPPHKSRARSGHHRAGAGGGDRRNGSWARRGRRTGRTCVPSCPGADLDAYPALADLNTGIDVPGVALADVRGPPRGGNGPRRGSPGEARAGNDPGRAPFGACIDAAGEGFEPERLSKGREEGPIAGADPPGAAVTRCDPGPSLVVIHTLCTCAQGDPRPQPEGSSTAPVVLVLVPLRAQGYRAPS